MMVYVWRFILISHHASGMSPISDKSCVQATPYTRVFIQGVYPETSSKVRNDCYI